jgi:transcriptional regulator with XRE-family HTH domain
MQQPELGRRLTALRKEKNLTQEELVEKSHVSVRTIQRIEAGEVLPRMITVKILLEALGESYESFAAKSTQVMESRKTLAPSPNRNSLLVAAIAGIIYMVSEVVLSTMDIAWLFDSRHWGDWINPIYTGLTILMVTAFIFFMRGFIVLSTMFENTLLKPVAIVLIIVVILGAALDITSLSVEHFEDVWIQYSMMSVMFGALSIAFGVALIRLQDGMGELSRIAGVLEIAMGCVWATVVLFFFAYVIFIPAVVLEILILFRGYEYLSRSASPSIASQ